MQISVTIDENDKNRVIDAFCAQYGYQETINGKPNPQTKAAFAKAKVLEYIKEIVKGHEAGAAAKAAIETAVASADQISIT